MSVQKLKLISLVGPIGKFDDIAKCCLTSERFEPVRATQLSTDVKNLIPFETDNPYSALLDSLTAVMDLAGYPKERVTITDYNPDVDGETARIDKLGEKLRAIETEISDIRAEIEDNKETIAQIQPLLKLNIELGRIFNMKFVDARFGKMPTTSYNNLIYYGTGTSVTFMPLDTRDMHVWGICFAPRSQKSTADALLSSLNFEQIRLSERITETPEKSITLIRAKNERLEEKMNALYAERNDIVTHSKDDLVKAYSKYYFLAKCYDLRRYAMRSDDEFFVAGWVPARYVSKFKKYVSEDYDINLIIEDPEEVAHVTPPTRIQNIWGVRFFEMFTEMYGLPSYNEIDPTLLVALTYTVFFGIMFGDVGQGLILALGGALLWKLKRMKLARIVAVIGLSSTLFGFLYGSIFGNEEIIHGFSVLHGNNTLTILLFAAAFGILLIGMAMVLNIINGIRQKDPKKYLFSPNGICGFLFFYGLVAGALVTFLTDVKLLTPLYIVFVLVLPLLLIFFGSPLSKLMQHKKDAFKIKWGEYIVENFFELFEVMLSFLSNVISYVRIGAFAISHAGMMLVITAMAKMLGGTGEIIVLIFGNIFVMCLEGLIVGIQCLRLQFYEFFSRFYSGGGKPFKPFS